MAQMKLSAVLIAALVLLIIDIPWLAFTKYVVRDPFYESARGGRLWAAVLVYLAMAYLLLLQPNAIQAAKVGLATYAVYDFTNMALFGSLGLLTGFSDVLWGGTLFYLTYTALETWKLV